MSGTALLEQYRPVTTDAAAIYRSAAGGISATAIPGLLALMDVSRQVLAKEVLGLSAKTISRALQDKRTLDQSTGEHLLKLLQLYDKGISLFGDAAAFNRWLRKPAHGLFQELPFSLLRTIVGIDLIYDELVRIEYGDLA